MIAAISASGRPGSNSTALLESALSAAAQGGAIARHDLASISFQGCTGCSGCRKGAPGCVLKDDLTPVLADVARASAVIISGPVYYGYVSGIMKSFLDRWYGFKDAERNLRMPSGRKLLALIAQGHPDEKAYERMTDELERVYAAYGFRPVTLVGAGLEAPGSAFTLPDLLKRAFDLGHGLAADADWPAS